MDVGADRLAGRLQAGRLLAHRQPPHLDLDRVEAQLDVAQQFLLEPLVALAVEVVAARRIGGDRVLVVRAEQLVEGQPRRLGVVIPQRDVERRQRAHRRAGAPVQQRFLIHRGPQPLDQERIPAQQQRSEEVVNGRSHQLPVGVAGVAEADAGVPVVALDFDHRDVAVVDGAVRERGRVVERDAQHARPDGGDRGHRCAPRLRRGGAPMLSEDHWSRSRRRATVSIASPLR